MTYTAAKKAVKEFLQSFVIIGFRGGKVYHTEAFKKVFQAVDKQIPQRVKRRPYLCIHTTHLIQHSTHCPMCNALVSDDRCHWVRPFSEPEHYCYRCGQALDWRE